MWYGSECRVWPPQRAVPKIPHKSALQPFYVINFEVIWLFRNSFSRYQSGCRVLPPHIHTYTHTHIHIHTYIRTHIHTYTHTHIHIYTHTHTHTYTHTHISVSTGVGFGWCPLEGLGQNWVVAPAWVSVSVCVWVWVWVCVCVCVCVYVCACVCVCVYLCVFVGVCVYAYLNSFVGESYVLWMNESCVI